MSKSIFFFLNCTIVSNLVFITQTYFPLLGIMLCLEIQRGKAEVPKWSSRYHELEATASSSIRAIKHMANCGQKESKHRRTCVVSDAWFASVQTAEAKHECCHAWIGIIKTSFSLYPKKRAETAIEDLARWNEFGAGSNNI